MKTQFRLIGHSCTSCRPDSTVVGQLISLDSIAKTLVNKWYVRTHIVLEIRSVLLIVVWSANLIISVLTQVNSCIEIINYKVKHQSINQSIYLSINLSSVTSWNDLSHSGILFTTTQRSNITERFYCDHVDTIARIPSLWTLSHKGHATSTSELTKFAYWDNKTGHKTS